MNFTTPSQRLPALDFLRALAVTLVFFFHLNNSVFSAGWSGVFLFFVLSGYLIGRLTFKETEKTGSLSLKRFWIKRIFRTWPLYFTLLFLSIFRKSDISPPLIHYFTFTQNFYPQNTLIQSWSLAIEEQFYLFFPILILMILKFRIQKWIPGLCVSGILFSYFFRFQNLGNGTHTFAAFDSLLWGILLAYADTFQSKKLEFIRKQAVLFTLAGGLIAYSLFSLPSDSIGSHVFLQGFLGLGFAVVLSANTGKNPPLAKLGNLPGVSFIALISYSIYLLQDRTLFWSNKIIAVLSLPIWMNPFAFVFIGTISTIFIATVFYYFIEKPPLR